MNHEHPAGRAKGQLISSPESMSEELRHARRKAGLSQAQAAESARISERTVRDSESGRCRLSTGTLTRLLTAYGVRAVFVPYGMTAYLVDHGPDPVLEAVFNDASRGGPS